MTQDVSHEIATPNGHSSRAKRWGVKILKLVLIVAVLAAVGRHIWSLTDDWRAQGASVHVRAGWVAVSAIVYLLGLALCGEFWRRLLVDAGLSVPRLELLRAYFIGHLGKYIPGKAMVVVLRTGLIDRGALGAVRVALLVIYETVAMMAVGAIVAAVCLVIAAPLRWEYWGGALGMAVALLVVLHPVVYGRLSRLVSLPFGRDPADVTSPPRYGTLVGRGGFLLAAGWVLLGLSLMAVGRAIGVDAGSIEDLLISTGAAAMGTVAGFLVLFMPSGIGVREVIVIELLEPQFGPSAAVGMSILLRLVWVISELCVAGVLYKWPIRTAKD